MFSSREIRKPVESLYSNLVSSGSQKPSVVHSTLRSGRREEFGVCWSV